MLKKLSVLLFICFLWAKCDAQFSIRYKGREIDYSTSGVSYLLATDTAFTDANIHRLFRQRWEKVSSPKLNISFSNQTTWLRIPLNTIYRYGAFDYVQVSNPHINFLKCWLVKGDSIIRSFPLTGDNLPFSTRPLPIAHFVFPVAKGISPDCDVVFAADKRFTKLDLPIVFATADYHFWQNSTYELIFGLIIGFCVFLLLFNTYLFATSRQQFYLWYCLYLLLIVVYLSTNGGLFFKYITPHHPQFNDILRPIAISLVEVPLLLFFIHLLGIKSRFPATYKTIRIIVWAYIIAFALAIYSLNFGGYQTHGILLRISSYIVPSFLLYCIILSVYFVRKKVPFSLFSLVSFTLFTSFILIYSLQQKELLENNLITYYASYWAIFSETFTATFLLAWQYKYYREQSKILMLKNSKLQQQIFKETAAWQEKELLRLSGLLHDTVGANLGLLRLQIDHMPLSEEGRVAISGQIKNIGNEVRAMSHTFSPFVLKNKGVYAAIADTVNSIRESSDIDLHFEWVGETDGIPLQHEVVIHQIVQELFQNMLKHSKAKSAHLQILRKEHLVSVYYEDDGVGFNKKEQVEGIGLKNIENLINLLNGLYRVESNVGDGIIFSVEFSMRAE